MTERNIKEMFKMMDTCISAVDALQTEMRLGFDKLNSEIAELKTDVAQLKTDFAEMSKRMDAFSGKQDDFELQLRRNNRALDRVAGHWIRTDIQIGRLEDAML